MKKTIEEIENLRKKKRKELDLRVNENVKTKKRHILICNGTGCVSSKSPMIMDKLKKLIKQKDIKNVEVIKTGCFGLCSKGPIIVVRPEDTFYSLVSLDDVEEIVNSHIIEGKIVERLLCKDIDVGVVNKLDELPFYKKQKRIVLKNCGLINPEDIDEYIAFDGYKALEKVLTKMTKEEVIKEISDSGLRGRGGAGFPTGKKWEFVAKEPEGQKYIVCNADEGDPGAFMDRSVLEGDPHTVLEAMTIAGFACRC